MKSKRKLFLLLVFLIPLVIISSQCLTSNTAKPDPRGDIFAGSAACMQCHKDVYDNYLHTAHFSATSLSSESNVHGSFHNGSNAYAFNKDLKVVMEKRGDGLYQVTYLKGKEIRAERFDITFGGVKAESYLYWHGNEMYQLPMSYFKALNSWTDSPGFDSTRADYGRMIGTRCFECHSSYIKELPAQNQSLLNRTVEYDKNSLVLGIDCERCHGPSANHVNYHLAYPEEKKAKYIATYASLSRAQKLDMCAVCHSGNKSRIIGPIFAFKPGDNLADFKEVDYFQPAVDSTKLDVHGNQNQLLASSKCFIMSKMDCATCHNVHNNERDQIAMYSQKCMNCHSTANHNFCKMAPAIGGIIKNNCIDCHMPARQSNVIAVQTAGKGRAIPYQVRTHHIAVYTDASQAVINYLKKYNKLQAH
jgi:hypothetical protein